MSFTPELLDDAQLARLRAALGGFTVDTVHARLGEAAWYALMRGETVPARRATGDGSALSTLIRLFQLQVPCPSASARQVFGDVTEALVASGILERDGDELRAAVDIRPYGDESHDWWVVCDLTPGLDARPVRVGPQHVLGISEASSSLAQLTVRAKVGKALDLGTGCGVQALHLGSHADEVVASDVNPRALQMARLTARLNEVRIDVREGSLYDPVGAERFDLIVSNPPFVVSPPDGPRLTYRETGFPGDDVVRHVVTGAAQHLAPGGWCQVLAAWTHRETEPWQERLASWIGPSGLDAWVVQREAADLATYAEMWLADSGARSAPDYVQRYDHWLTWLADQGIEAMGFGWICLRNAGREYPVLRLEEWAGEIGQPLGPAVLGWGGRVDALDVDADVLERRWRLAADARQVTHGPVGASDPATITVHLEQGPRRAARVDTIEAGLLSASDGELTAGQILDALATLLGRDRAELRTSYAPVVRELVADGFLVP